MITKVTGRLERVRDGIRFFIIAGSPVISAIGGLFLNRSLLCNIGIRRNATRFCLADMEVLILVLLSTSDFNLEGWSTWRRSSYRFLLCQLMFCWITLWHMRIIVSVLISMVLEIVGILSLVEITATIVVPPTLEV